MKQLPLTLRQRKLLHHMMNQRAMVTGGELAKELGVTDRTIRSDINEINRNIIPLHAEIKSEKSKGYCFVAENAEKIRELNRTELGLLTKEERVRYMAYRLCLSSEPVHMLDLEDEMYTSHTTLEQDLKLLKKLYVKAYPFIHLSQKNGSLFFERDEKKIRMILIRLVHDDWNYNKSGNAYYGYHYINEPALNYIMDIVPAYLYKYGIYMEDPALVYLDIMLAVSCQRYSEGMKLQEKPEMQQDDELAVNACNDIFHDLEKHFGCPFPDSEKNDVYTHIVKSRLPDMSDVTGENVADIVTEDITGITDIYLEKIRNIFGLDLSGDDDFYVTLSLTIYTFQKELYVYNSQGNFSLAKDRMMDEYEIAMLFQEISGEYLGRLLTEIELINLAHCIGGALIYMFQSHPELKLRTVICSHRNMMTLWHMKRMILSEFNTYLDVTDIIPVNSCPGYDFSRTDLVLATDNRKITDDPRVQTICINHFITPKDLSNISSFIDRKRFERFCPVPPAAHNHLLENAFWHEKENRKSVNDIIRILAKDFDDDEKLSGRLLNDVLQREAVSSFVTGRSIAFLHSAIPAAKTRLSIMTLDHRIVWNNCKIRIIVMGAFRAEDLTMLFYLKHLFYDQNREEMRMLKTKDEVCNYFYNK